MPWDRQAHPAHAFTNAWHRQAHPADAFGHAMGSASASRACVHECRGIGKRIPHATLAHAMRCAHACARNAHASGKACPKHLRFMQGCSGTPCRIHRMHFWASHVITKAWRATREPSLRMDDPIRGMRPSVPRIQRSVPWTGGRLTQHRATAVVGLTMARLTPTSEPQDISLVSHEPADEERYAGCAYT